MPLDFYKLISSFGKVSLVLALSVFMLAGCVPSKTISQIVHDDDPNNPFDETAAPMLLNSVNAKTTSDLLPTLVYDPNNEEPGENNAKVPVYTDDVSKAETDEPAARPVFLGSSQDNGQASTQAEEDAQDRPEQQSGETTRQRSKNGSKAKKSKKGKNRSTKRSDKTNSSGGNKSGGKKTGKVTGGKGDGTGSTYTGDVGSDPVIPDNIDEVAAVGNYAVIVSMVSGTSSSTALKACDSSTKKQTNDLLAGKGMSKVSAVWENDGTSTGDLTDKGFSKLLEQDVIPDLIFVEEGAKSLSKGQLETLKDSKVDVYTLPSLTSQKSIRFSVEVIGRILAKGKVGGAEDNYKEYLDYENDLVEKYVDKNGGITGGYNYDTSKRLDRQSEQTVTSLMIDGWEDDARFKPGGINTSNGIATATLGYRASPLSRYMSIGGVLNNAASSTFRKADDGDDGLVWQFQSNWMISTSNWSGLPDSVFDLENISAVGQFRKSLLCFQTSNGNFYGLGTDNYPAVIAKSSYLAKKFQNESKRSGQLYYPYPVIVDERSSVIGLNVGSQVITSCVGNDGSGSQKVGSDGFDVYVNPKGLAQSDSEDVLCSWSDGSLESVLESSWVYWKFRGGSQGDFEDEVKKFYKQFYAYDLSDAELNSIVSGPKE